MLDEVLKQVSGFDTSREAWIKLEKKISSKSRAKIIQMKGELQNLKKDSISVSDYVLKIKSLRDEHESAGCSILEEEKLMYVLVGLDDQFDSVSSIVIENMLGEGVTINDVKAFFLSHESQLESKRVANVSPLPSINLSVKTPLVF